MMSITQKTTAALAALVLAATLAHGAEPTTAAVPAFAVPRMSKAPTIDGAIDPAEWQGAMAVSGAADQSTDASKPLLPRPTTFFLGWDEGHLYFACRTWLRPGYKPNVPAGRSEGLAYVWDDALELNWFPMGGNVAPDNAKSSYKWFLNTLGFIGDCSRLALGQQFKSWNPKFVIKTRLTESGTAPGSGSWWEMEMRATTADFELVGPHKAGDQWRMMLGINHIPGWMQARIPCHGPYLDPFGYNLMTLVEDAPAVQMTMDSLSNLATDGTAALTVRAFNPTKAPVELALAVTVADAIKKNETLTVPAGQSVAFALNEKLPEAVKKGQLSVEITRSTGSGQAAGDQPLFWYTVPFQVGAYAHMLAPVAPPDPTKFAFETRFNPVRSWLLVKADSYYLDDPAQAKVLRYQVLPDGSTTAKPVAEGRITQIAEYYLQDVIHLPPLAPGKYRVEATMELADGRTLGPMTGNFEKKNEADAYAHWWGKKYGDIERVLPPYEAIRRVEGGRLKVEGKAAIDHQPSAIDHFSLLGREYAFDALGLPVAIRSAGEAVLAAPARIVVSVDGQETVIQVGKPKITEQKDWRVRFEGSAEGAGLKFTAIGWLEQDGLVYVDLTYAPMGNTPVTVEALRIEYPLAETDADGLMCVGPGENYSSRTTMLLPKADSSTLTPGPSPKGRGEERLWSTLDTGITGSGMTVGSFYPTVWIGSERRGFLWWADNDKGWVQDNAVPAHEVRRVPSDQLSVIGDRSASADNRQPITDNRSAVVFINNIIAKPARLAEARTIAFSYIATPFKPLSKGFRTIHTCGPNTFFAPFRGVRNDSKTGEPVLPRGPGLNHVNWIHPESRYPEEWASLWEEQRTKGHWNRPGADAWTKSWIWTDPTRIREGVNLSNMSFQLYGYGRKTLEDHLYAYFGNEWEPDTWNESYTDYAMYLFSRAFKEGGVRSTYWDLTFPILFKELLSGLAYQLPDGRVQRGYHGWNVRRFMMRLWALQYDNGLTPGGNSFHSTNAYLPVAMPWADLVLDGERNWNLDSNPLDWVDNMPIDRMRAKSVPHSWGVGITWMANFDSVDKQKKIDAARVQAQWVWMHDSWVNQNIKADHVPQLPFMPDAVLDWGIGDIEKTIYHPYWRNPYVTSEDGNVLVSLWRLPDRVLLGVFNYDNRETKDATLTIDLDALNLTHVPWQHFVRVRDLWKGDDGPDASLNYYGRTLHVKDLKPHRLRLIGIRRY